MKSTRKGTSQVAESPQSGLSHPIPHLSIFIGVRIMASASNRGTPLPEEVGKPPEGVVLPPKDIRGKFVDASEPW